jgi:hypothetical protein
MVRLSILTLTNRAPRLIMVATTDDTQCVPVASSKDTTTSPDRMDSMARGPAGVAIIVPAVKHSSTMTSPNPAPHSAS